MVEPPGALQALFLMMSQQFHSWCVINFFMFQIYKNCFVCSLNLFGRSSCNNTLDGKALSWIKVAVNGVLATYTCARYLFEQFKGLRQWTFVCFSWVSHSHTKILKCKTCLKQVKCRWEGGQLQVRWITFTFSYQ